MRTLPRLLLAAGLVLGSSGCSAFFRGYDVAPNGMLRSDDQLRRALVTGAVDSLLLGFEARDERLPEDPLLRALYQGVLAYHAGDPAASAARLELAEALAEDRYTKSASRAALSLVTSDNALPYEPGTTERLLIHYYGALAWLGHGNADEAAVEARRLSALLDRLGGSGTASELEAPLRGFAAAVFEAAGEWNDASVAARKAAAAAGVAGADMLEPAAPPAGHGEVVVLLERGYVAHRAEETLWVLLDADHVDALATGFDDHRAARATEVTGLLLAELAGGGSSQRGHGRHVDLTGRVARAEPAGRTLASSCAGSKETGPRTAADEGDPRAGMAPDSARGLPLPRPVAAAASGGDCHQEEEKEDRNPYLLKLAWPAFRQDGTPGGAASLLTPEGERVWFGVRLDVSRGVEGDFAADQGWRIARLLLRAASKATFTRSLETEVAKKDETVGRVLGALSNAGTALLEQADLRSWHLLPHEILLARVTLPAGTHALAVEVDAPTGVRRVELPAVTVQAGATAVLSHRLWR